MNTIQHIARLLKETYEGHPWHGRSIKALLSEVTPEMGLKKPAPGAHSIAELIYHMVNWREFTLTRLQPRDDRDVSYYERNDWQTLDLNNFQTWEQGLQLLEETQQRLMKALEQLDESILPQIVNHRKYNFKLLLYGVVQHDIYHAGQIAYAMKLLS